MHNIALQATSCYNSVTIKMLTSAMLQASARVRHIHWRNVSMSTLPPHAQNDNTYPVPATSGIYKITCIPTGKIYIGSSVNVRDRRTSHFGSLRQNKHANLHLQRAWNKYGESAFTFEVLELVLPISLTAREQYWLNKLKPFNRRGFNILPIAGSPSGYKHTPEAIDKIRASNSRRKLSTESIEKIRQANTGKKYLPGRAKSPEHREKLRQARLGTKLSPETREKVRQAGIGRYRSPEAIEKQRQSVLGRKKSPEAIEKYRKIAQERWKLSPAEIESIQIDHDSGMTYRQIIKKYGIGGTRLAKILRGEV